MLKTRSFDKKWFDLLTDDLNFVYDNNIKELIDEPYSEWKKKFPYAWSFEDGEYFPWSTGQIEFAECWFNDNKDDALLTHVTIRELYIKLSDQEQEELKDNSEYQKISLDGTVIIDVDSNNCPDEVKDLINTWENKINQLVNAREEGK